MSWWNEYVGIPYQEKGRARDGADCWGLVRLVYKDQYGIELPSFTEVYEAKDKEQIAELFATQREGWEPTTEPKEGDVVAMRVFGEITHVGVIAAPGTFLHVRRGISAAIERLDTPMWKHRIEGFFKYSEKKDTGAVALAAMMHPLRTERIDGAVPAGLTLQEIYERLLPHASQMRTRVVLMLNGLPIPQDQWGNCTPFPNDRVECRAVPADGEDLIKTALFIAVVIYAPQLSGEFFANTAIGQSIIAATPFTYTQLAAAGSVLLTTAGSMLINQIFPYRPPSFGDLGGGGGGDTAERQLFLQGGNNQITPYGAVPVVLGSFRYAGPSGMTPWAETTDSLSYLRMLVVWGYGPLIVKDLTLAETPIQNFDEVQIETLDYQDTSADRSRFKKLTGTERVQNNISLELTCLRKTIASASRSGGVLTVNTSGAHGFSTGWFCRVYSAYNENGSAGGEQTPTFTAIVKDVELTVVDSDTFTVASSGSDGSVTAVSVDASAWTETTINEEVEDLGITLHFPEGIRTIVTEGSEGGKSKVALSEIHVQRRRINPSTGAPLESYKNAQNDFAGGKFNLTSAGVAFYDWYTGQTQGELYQWTRVSLNAKGQMVTRTGQLSDTSTAVMTVGSKYYNQIVQQNYGKTVDWTLKPAIPSGETLLWDILVFGNSVSSVVDQRGVAVTGGNYSLTWPLVTISSAAINEETDPRFTLIFGRSGKYKKRKDAISYTANFDVTAGAYQVRARRANYDNADVDVGGNNWRRLTSTYLQFVTGIKNTTPVAFPKALAMSAFRIKATNQINGNIQGISALVQSVCKDYDTTTSPPSWVVRPTSNPASLFRYVLQHPANAQAVSDSELDLASIEAWHTYCKQKKFAFNTVVIQQKSLFEVLKDVCAAGRASPTMRDGKWSVVIDKPQTTIRQHFTPHNSWGFSATRIYPKLPHAFRVSFNNEGKGYQPDEMMVYNDGYSISNATYFEGLQLPGVTHPNLIYQHARFHLAQLKLRPESYTLNVDMEHIVCTRGDLVRVTHDVPLWGRASGRIKSRASNGVDLTLEEEVLMVDGTQYGLRIRLADGTSITRTIAAKTGTAYYSTITLTSSVTATQGAAGNLFMMGDMNAESVECLVQSIEPTDNYCARITLVDYSPAVYDSDDETIPTFNSQITRPQKLIRKLIQQKPTIVSAQIRSDESVLTVISPGVFEYNLRVPFTNASGLTANIAYVEAQIDSNEDSDDEWGQSITVKRSASSVTFKDVEEGDEYRIRLRYVDDDGNVGQWTTPVTHTIIGKTSKPQTAGAITFTISNSRLKLDWANNSEPDLKGYMLRAADSGWGTSGYIYKGASSEYLATAKTPGTYTYYLKAYDLTNLYSATARSGSFTIFAPSNPASVTQTIVKTTKTVVELALDWNDVTPTSQQYPIGGYEIRTSNSGWGSNSSYLYKGNASAARLKNISATATTTFYLRTYDLNGNYAASSLSFVHDVTAPATMASASVTTTRLKSVLQFSIASAPAIPTDFDAYEFQIGKVGSPGIPDGTTDNFWDNANCVKVDSTTIKAQIDVKLFPTPRFSTSGVKYRVAVRMRDKSGNYSAASALGSITVTKIT